MESGNRNTETESRNLESGNRIIDIEYDDRNYSLQQWCPSNKYFVFQGRPLLVGSFYVMCWKHNLKTGERALNRHCRRWFSNVFCCFFYYYHFATWWGHDNEHINLWQRRVHWKEMTVSNGIRDNLDKINSFLPFIYLFISPLTQCINPYRVISLPSRTSSFSMILAQNAKYALNALNKQ